MLWRQVDSCCVRCLISIFVHFKTLNIRMSQSWFDRQPWRKWNEWREEVKCLSGSDRQTAFHQLFRKLLTLPLCGAGVGSNPLSGYQISKSRWSDANLDFALKPRVTKANVYNWEFSWQVKENLWAPPPPPPPPLSLQLHHSLLSFFLFLLLCKSTSTLLKYELPWGEG